MGLSKYIYDEFKQKFDIEDALTITKGKWADNNEDNEDRIGYFVTLDNVSNEVEIANSDSYICGVTIQNDTFLYPDVDDPKYCVVQSLGLCAVRDDGTLQAGEKCMPSDTGIAVRSSNSLGYRVVGRIDEERVGIIMIPNSDMIQRIKDDQVKSKEISITTTDWILDEDLNKYVATIAWDGITNDDRVDVNLDLESLPKAENVLAVTETGEGYFYMYASEALEEDITGVAYRVVVSC